MLRVIVRLEIPVTRRCRIILFSTGAAGCALLALLAWLAATAPGGGAFAGARGMVLLALFAISAALTAGVAIVLLTRHRVCPLRRLCGYVDDLGGSAPPPDPSSLPPEVNDLARHIADLRQTAQSHKEVEEYVQAMTHEMKSPLSAILGAAELLQEDLEPDQRQMFLKNIQTESWRIRDLVDHMLELSSLENRAGLEDAEDVSLGDIVADVLSGLQPTIAGKQMQVIVDGPGQVVIKGERFLLRQSVANLVQNALDFSPEKGMLQIAVRGVDGHAEVEVKDSGPGIPDYAKDKIFQRFYSLRRPSTGRRSSGLGLKLVKAAAELHGGSISLENAPTGGAVATLRLPVVPPAGASHRRPTGAFACAG